MQGVCEKVAEAFEKVHGVRVDPTTQITICCGQSEAMAASVLAGTTPIPLSTPTTWNIQVANSIFASTTCFRVEAVRFFDFMWCFSYTLSMSSVCSQFFLLSSLRWSVYLVRGLEFSELYALWGFYSGGRRWWGRSSGPSIWDIWGMHHTSRRNTCKFILDGYWIIPLSLTSWSSSWL